MASCSASAAEAANCGGAALGGGSSGPPSISATEASTTQVLEEIRRRQEVAQQQAQLIPASETTTVAAAQTTTSGGGGSTTSGTSSGGSTKPAAQATTVAPSTPAKPKYTKIATAETGGGAYEYNEYGGTQRITSSWGQGYLDYEHHDNINAGAKDSVPPGAQESRDSRTAGYMSGTDWTWISASATPQLFQFGLFSGYQGQFNTFSNTNFQAAQTTDASGTDTFSRTQNKQDITGGFYGAYMAYLHGNETYDFAFKADVYDLNQTSLLTQTNAAPGCGGAPFTAIEAGGASVNNYTFAGNASYRHWLSEHSWLEPTIGIRYTITDYGNDATVLLPSGLPGSTIAQENVGPARLGLEDGTYLRLQAGLRAGQVQQLANGTIWTLLGGAYIYSDVLVTGFRFNAPTVADNGANSPGPAGTDVFPVDEGKVRGLGQLVSTWDYNDGWSYLLAGEIRGGEDLFGVGGRVGARYQW